MIHYLAIRYQKQIASLLLILAIRCIVPAYGTPRSIPSDYLETYRREKIPARQLPPVEQLKNNISAKEKVRTSNKTEGTRRSDIGGPNQPEMSSFKSAGTDNMVNLFTGDFSYNIPLMDVGGYPINIFYSGDITLEQEASWVGLGWNINPGNVSRNMRGIPDDFNGNDIIRQTQKVKPNRTIGASVGADIELVGIKQLADIVSGSAGASLGFSYNNYLGPALDLTLKGTTNISLANKAGSEKSAAKIGGGINANISSRSGVTLSPTVSLTANIFSQDRENAFGSSVRLGTSYNSRVGIRTLQLSEQMSFNNYNVAQGSTSISFARPTYIPSIRMPLTNRSEAGHFQLGAGIFGFAGSIEGEVYRQISEVDPLDVTQYRPLVGYLYYENANNNPGAVMDFTRLNDNEVTPNTPVISAPQYAYDVFSIQGEGTGGSIRAYRSDMGAVRDNVTRSRDKSFSAGVDLDPPGHYGGNYNTVQTPTVIQEWINGNKFRNVRKFKSADKLEQGVYFKNPNETTVLIKDQYKHVGDLDLVRFKLGTSSSNPTVEPILEKFNKSGVITGNVMLTTDAPLTDRAKRGQIINFLTATEASDIGLDRKIKSYDANVLLDQSNNLKYDQIERVSEYRKGHHISQISVTETNGKRYVYGIPVYNIVQEDFTFSVGNNEILATNLVNFAPLDTSLSSTYFDNTSKDAYLQVTQTPAYAQNFLLSGLLSTDYVDITGNGITEDDIGDAVKFNYTRIGQPSAWVDHQWRSPHAKPTDPEMPANNGHNIANFNPGSRSETKDDKGVISYGKRESWYVHSIESKNLIALFTLEDRDDGKGVQSAIGRTALTTAIKRLKKIDLYNKVDLKKNGLAGSRPIKTVTFEYNYSLCNGTPDNLNNGGKLSLTGIYFTFNGRNKTNKSKYVFSYGSGSIDNPDYKRGYSDRWGNYKQPLSGVKNADYPYAEQDKTKADQYAAAWKLKKILLPSGGQMEISYESDDYAFVQNRTAALMMNVAGAGSTSSTITNKLFSQTGAGYIDHDYVFINVPESCQSKPDVLKKYLAGVQQLAFKMLVNVPKGQEYISAYGTISDYGVYDESKIWIKLNKVDGFSPLTLSAVDFLRERLPGQAFTGYDLSTEGGLKQIGEMVVAMGSSIADAFKDPRKAIIEEGRIRTFDEAKSFVRLNDPDGRKYGGGYRVKTINLKDNWSAMTQQYTSEYGQIYDYSITENFKGAEKAISSGVASYEPTIGGEENPFQQIMQISNKLPLGPASFGAIEMPMLDAFFPAPLVGYRKVTVKAIRRGDISAADSIRSGIGKQVTEFYTAKEFPVSYAYTSLDPGSDKQEHNASLIPIFYKYAFDSRAISQGFIVQTNDMHGKMKSQSSYMEGDESTRINYTENFYRNTGNKGMNEKFDFIYGSKSGEIEEGNMGIDVELMTDTREFSVNSSSIELQGQADMFPVVIPFWIPTLFNIASNSENIYRAVTTTKVINYHSIVDSVVVIDKTSMVSTKNLVYDAETGEVIITRTNNEFDKPVFNIKQPAYWAYSGMGPSYKNIDAVYNNVNFLDGKIVSPVISPNPFESGDELYILNSQTPASVCGQALETKTNIKLIWAFDRNKSATGLTNSSPDFVFLDSSGKLFTKDNVKFRIVRSGKRNILSASVGEIKMMADPIATVGQVRKLLINTGSQVISAGALQYQEQWQTDNDIFSKFIMSFDANTCTYKEIVNCNGYYEKHINPYCKGLLGNYKNLKSFVFYNDRAENNPLAETNVSQNGFMSGFQLYWNFDVNANLIPSLNSKWEANSSVTRINSKGMELETKDALNVYTSALYGYNKTLPTAITNNSKYNEQMFTGFEDDGYNQSINNATQNICAKPHFFTEGDHLSGIVNADNLGFNAHTGKYAYKVAANSTSLSRSDISVPPTTFTLPMTRDTIKSLYQTGGNVDSVFMVPYNAYQTAGVPGATSPTDMFRRLATFANGDMSFSGFNMKDTTVDNGNTRYHQIKVISSYYINVTATGTYTFSVNFDTGYSCNIRLFRMYMEVLDTSGNVIRGGIGLENSPSYTINSVNLCKGIYKIRTTLTTRTYITRTTTPPPNWELLMPGTNGNKCGLTSQYGFQGYCPSSDWSCYDNGTNQYVYYASSFQTNASTVNYKNLTTQNGCIYTNPIVSNPTMFNPVFAPEPDQKMVVSAWVRESCANISQGSTCPATYTKGKINVQFEGSGTSFDFVPSGPIIEGWQRIDTVFSVPASATKMNMRLTNTGNDLVFFDDLRVHPFNANMKNYVYDNVNLRLIAELDPNNYASYYEYDEEGTLIRNKVETKEGIKTIRESRSFKQTGINTIQ